MSPEFYLSIFLGASFSHGLLIADPPGSPENSLPFKTANYEPVGRAAIGASMGNWGLEIGAGNLAKRQQSRQFTGADPEGDTSGFNYTLLEADVRARYRFGLGGKWEGYGEVGIALIRWRSEQWQPARWGWVSKSGYQLAPQVGAGIGYALSPAWSIGAGATYTPAISDLPSVWQMGAGLRYTFR